LTLLSATSRASFGERNFKYLLIGPAILVLLLIGIFPLVYLLLVSFQGITMTETSTDFIGFANYAQLFEDTRLWEALLHTVIFTLIALPLELLLGLAMGAVVPGKVAGRQIFVALLVLPVVVSPIVSGATWSLMFNHRFGPITKIIGWIWGEEVTLLWTISPLLVYPAIVAAEVWQWTPFMFLLLLAALANVDKSQLEAAAIDGAAVAHFLQDRAAGHLAGDGDRHPDPRTGLVPLVRHRLGAHQGRPRHHDRDHFDLHLHQGLPAVRDQLHRGSGLPGDHPAVGGGDAGVKEGRIVQMMTVRQTPCTAHRCALAAAAAITVLFLFPIYCCS